MAIRTWIRRHFSHKASPCSRSRWAPQLELLEARELLSISGYTPAQIRHAYGVDQITFENGRIVGDGAGTTIAIVEALGDPNITSDLHTFDTEFGLPDPVLNTFEDGGTPGPLPFYNSDVGNKDAIETALDVEWAHAIAPEATIDLCSGIWDGVYAASTLPGVDVVSVSYGFGEDGTTPDYTNLVRSGVTLVVSSGDIGAEVETPADMPDALAVGGTTLNLNGDSTIASETGWSGSGGGFSAYEPQPTYQESVLPGQTMRAVPDVAYDANPSTGFAIYCTGGDNTGWLDYGGTSAGAPQWAALIAIADQGRAAVGEAPLDGLTQTLPMLYALPASDFNDITSGSTTITNASGDALTQYCTPGYDLVTGLGSPRANLIVPALVGMSSTTVTSSTDPAAPGQSVTFTATVSAMGPATGTPTGYVTFEDLDYGSMLARVPLINGVATYTAATNSEVTGPGVHTVSAFYLGDTDFAPSVSSSLTQTVYDLPQFTSGTSATFQSGWQGSFTVTATGTITPQIHETGALPAGVTFTANNNGSATLSGTPATGSGGVYNISFLADYGVGLGTPQTFTLTIFEAAGVAGLSTFKFTAGMSGSITVTTKGYPFPIVTEAGALPPGLTFKDNGSSATIGGVPANHSGGAYALSFTASNFLGSGSGSDVIYVIQAPTITSPPPQRLTVGTAESFTLTAIGYPTPVIKEQGMLPQGLAFNPSTDTLSGTPAHGTGGEYPITFTAHNSASPDAVQTVTLTVDEAPYITSSNHDTVTVGAAVDFTFTAKGFPVPFLNLDPHPPRGLSFDHSTGLLSGTPASGTGGTYSFTVTAGNDTGVNATQTFSLTIDEAPSFTSRSSAQFTLGASSSFALTTLGFPAPFLSENGKLPAGVSFNSGAGTLSGTPALGTSGSYLFSFGARNGIGTNASQSFSLTVKPDATSVTVVASLNPSVSGQLVEFTATVTNRSVTGLVPTGAVQFVVDGSDLGTPVALSGGMAISPGIALPAGTHTVQADFSDSTGSFSAAVDTLSGGLTIYQVPSVAVSGPSNGVAYQPRTFTFLATGAADDLAAGLSYQINWGDSSPLETVPASANDASITENHVYSTTGTFTVSATATDQNDLTSSAASGVIQIGLAAVETDTAAEGGFNGLALSGAGNGAGLVLASTGAADTLSVMRASSSLGAFVANNGVVAIFGDSGTDAVTIDGVTSSANTFTLSGSIATFKAASLSPNGFDISLNNINAVTFQGGKVGNSFTNTEAAIASSLIGGAQGANSFTFVGSDMGAPAIIQGSGGNNTLIGPALAADMENLWYITANNAGNLNGPSWPFTGIQNLVGGSQSNDFIFDDGAKVTGNVDGGAGGTLDLSGYSSNVTVNLAANNWTGVGGAATNIVAVIGGSGDNTLTGPGAANVWNISGSNSGTLDGALSFANFANLTGGSTSDTFAFMPGGSIAGNLKGGAPVNTLDYSGFGSSVTVDLLTKTASGIGGTWSNMQNFVGNDSSDTLIGDNANRTWSITGPDAITVGSYSAEGFPNLVGGTGNNTFSLLPGGSLSGSVTGGGGGGANTLDYSQYGSPATIDLQTEMATGIGTFSALTAFKGDGTDTLIATDGTINTWALKGADAGTVDGVTFSGMANLTGGTGADDFELANGATISGAIDGAGGSNTLDYSAYTGGVIVNLGNATTGLANCSASGVNGGAANGIAHIANVIVGAGNNYLTAVGITTAVAFTATGNANNILVGGLGASTLIASGSGNNMVIGDYGTSTIVLGTGYNLAIGGHTAYDGSYVDLEAILGIWKTANSAAKYAKAIAELSAESYLYALNAGTVESNAADEIEAGTQALDWYFAAIAGEIAGEKAGEALVLC